MEELTRELEDLRNFKMDVEQRGLAPVMAVPADITMLKKREMEQQLVRLKVVGTSSCEMVTDQSALLEFFNVLPYVGKQSSFK